MKYSAGLHLQGPWLVSYVSKYLGVFVLIRVCVYLALIFYSVCVLVADSPVRRHVSIYFLFSQTWCIALLLIPRGVYVGLYLGVGCAGPKFS